MIPFRSSSLYKHSIDIKSEPFLWNKFEEEVELFNQHWYTTKAVYKYELGSPIVTIEFTHLNRDVCEAAATQFVERVRQFEWWVEV